MANIGGPFDPHEVWSSLDVDAKEEVLLKDVSNLSAQIQTFSNEVQRQANDLIDLWNAYFQLDRISQSLAAVISLVEWNRAHPSSSSTPAPSQPPPKGAKPQISVTEKSEGKFEVTGSGFTPNATVRIRAADDYAQQIWAGQTTANSNGKIDDTVTVNCIKGATIHFSATDDREEPSDPTGVLWSNYVALTC